VTATASSSESIRPASCADAAAGIVAAAMKAILTAIFIVFMRLFDKDRFSCNIFFSPEGV